jgi:toxin HigB-1
MANCSDARSSAVGFLCSMVSRRDTIGWRRVTIESFRCRDTERLFNHEFVRRFKSIAKQALKKLIQLHVARRIEDLRVPPSNRLEKLVGDKAGEWSIRVNSQWRVCFLWVDGNAHAVEIVGYH